MRKEEMVEYFASINVSFADARHVYSARIFSNFESGLKASDVLIKLIDMAKSDAKEANKGWIVDYMTVEVLAFNKI